MEKFNWQNGTLVSKAKVNIDGKIYEVEPEQYSGSTPISAENLNAMQDVIIENLKWLKLGETKGNATISLPESFKELLVVVKLNNNTNLAFNFNVPYELLSSIEIGLNNGYFSTSQSVSGFARIGVTKTVGRIISAVSNTTNVLNNSTSVWFYR